MKRDRDEQSGERAPAQQRAMDKVAAQRIPWAANAHVGGIQPQAPATRNQPTPPPPPLNQPNSSQNQPIPIQRPVAAGREAMARNALPV
jgi:hypothetical protein